MNAVRVADRLYCRKCIYAPPSNGHFTHLCDFCFQTGKSRGCPPGVGCKRRVQPDNKKAP